MIVTIAMEGFRRARVPTHAIDQFTGLDFRQHDEQLVSNVLLRLKYLTLGEMISQLFQMALADISEIVIIHYEVESCMRLIQEHTV